MFVAFVPFPTPLLFSSPTQSASVMLYAGTAAGMGLSLLLLWIYADRHRFLAPAIPRAVVRDIRLNWFLLIPVYIFRRHTESALKDGELI